MFKAIVGQTIGVVCIAGWLGATVYFMSRAATVNAPDQGNWFVGFIALTIVFIAIMAYWRRFFGEE